MFTGRRYGVKEFLVWTRRDLFFLLAVASVPTALFALAGWRWLSIPWVLIALLGTAVAFLVSLKNNSSYDRAWEARTAWGAIVNASRAWGIMAKDFVANDRAAPTAAAPPDELAAIRRQLIHRHVAWLTALRFQLREPRGWESMSLIHNVEYRKKYYSVPEREVKLDDALPEYLTREDFDALKGKTNRAAQIIALQSGHLRELHAAGLLDNFRHVEMENLLVELYRQQGVCERIKNYPYPRQFASLNFLFVKIFVVMLPFGLLGAFDELGPHAVWFNIPFSVLLGWVFTSLERSGEVTENPFEGGANDVPVTSLARNIEIDLREMIGEKNIPPPVPANEHNILM